MHAELTDGRHAAPTKPAQVRAEAWALKDTCVETWASQPSACAVAAERLAHLAEGSQDLLVHALRDWTQGLTRLWQGDVAAAQECLQRASTALDGMGFIRESVKAQLPQLAALSMLGRHEEARSLATAALQVFLEVGDEVSAAKTELNLGSMHLRQDQYEPAAMYYRRAAARFARLRDHKHSVMADTGLAIVLTWQACFSDALAMYERAEKRALQHGLHALLGPIALARGQLELNRERYGSALKHLQAALQDAERTGAREQLNEARRVLADAYLVLRLLPEAQALYTQVVDDRRAQGVGIELAWALTWRADAAVLQGRPAAALADLIEARAAFAAQSNPIGLALVDLRRAQLLLRTGEADATAAGLAADSRQVFESAGVRPWALGAQLVEALALHQHGEHAAAGALLKRLRAEAAEAPELAARAESALGAAAFAAGQWDEADAHWQSAINLFEAQRAQVPGDELQVSYGSDRQAAYIGRVRVALRLPGDAARRVFDAVERIRTQASRRATAGGPATDELLDLRQQLAWQQQALMQSLMQGRAGPDASQLRAMESLERRLREVQRRAQAGGDPQSAWAAGEWPGASAAHLERGEGIVSYMQLDDELLCCTWTSDGYELQRVPAADLADRIEQLRFQLSSLQHGLALRPAHAEQLLDRIRKHLQRLHQTLWQPIAASLAGCKRVVVLPAVALENLPFAALHDGEAWLIERHALVIGSSARGYLESRAHALAPLRRAALAGVSSPQLGEIRGELDAVSAALGDGDATEIHALIDAQATRAALLAEFRQADVLHLACHGQFRSDNPAFSALHVADGALTVHDIESASSSARLVTLSACESGRARRAGGSERLGLVRALRRAGVAQVVASDWPVDDARTAQLMSAFYRALAQGIAEPEALQQAQRALAGQHPHPFWWAAFAVYA